MSRWIEIVCDTCARQGPGRTVKRSSWAEIERDARARGWLVIVTAHSASYYCPSCRARREP